MPSLPRPSESDGLDDADALPAVGKVWDTGPKRSLSEILASAARKPAAQANSSTKATPQPSGELGAIWAQALEQVQEALGPAVHVPLSSGQPIREGDLITIRFGGPFSAMARYLEKYRDQIQATLSAAAGEAVRVVLEADAAGAVTAPPGNLPARQANENRPAPTLAPQREGIPLTPDLRASLEKDPLIRAIMEMFNGNIVKVE